MQKEITEKIRKILDNKTLIIVAHRLSTVKDADKIIVSKKPLLEKETQGQSKLFLKKAIVRTMAQAY